MNPVHNISTTGPKHVHSFIVASPCEKYFPVCSTLFFSLRPVARRIASRSRLRRESSSKILSILLILSKFLSSWCLRALVVLSL